MQSINHSVFSDVVHLMTLTAMNAEYTAPKLFTLTHRYV